MAASSRLKLSDIVAALDSLTIEQTKELIVRFGVEFKTVQDIEHKHKGSSSRKLHNIQTWLDQDNPGQLGKVSLWPPTDEKSCKTSGGAALSPFTSSCQSFQRHIDQQLQIFKTMKTNMTTAFKVT